MTDDIKAALSPTGARIVSERKRMYWFRTPITLDRAVTIRDRKSIWVKLYLEARKSGDDLKGYFRKQHRQALAQSNNGEGADDE